jgi:hypothetical protein
MADLGFSHSYFSFYKYPESDQVSITEVVVFFTTNPTKLDLQYSEFSTIFYTFYKFPQICNTIEVPPFTRVPRKNQTFADGSLVGTKHPIKKSGLAIGPLAMGGGGLAGIRRLRRRSQPGKRRGMTASSPRTDWQARLGRGSTPRQRPAGTAAAARVDHTRQGHEGGVWTAPNDLVARDGVNYSSAASAFMAGGAARRAARSGVPKGGRLP